jgi:dihydrofolate reductase/thymidylate synthase
MSIEKKFNIIAGIMKRSRGYSSNYGNLPWPTSKKDMAWFKKITTNSSDTIKSISENKLELLENSSKENAIIMGRKTQISLGNLYPLKNRLNLVLSKSDQSELINNKSLLINSKNKRFNSIESALEYAKEKSVEKVFLIGGSSLFNNDILNNKNCDKIYITEIEKEFEYNKNNIFPKIPEHFKLIDKIETYCQDIGSQIVFKTYQNKQDQDSDESQYIKLVFDILTTGEKRKTRNGVVISKFAPTQHVFDLDKGFPLLTTKKIKLRIIFEELMFFLRGHTDTNILKEKNVNIWNQNTTKEFIKQNNLKLQENDMGPMYGYNFRHYGYPYEGCKKEYEGKGYDQLYDLIGNLINNPYSRRHMMTSYDPSTAKQCVIYMCHGYVIQFYVTNDGKLDCQTYQRSADIPLGYPFNIASYSLLVHILCHVTGYMPGKLYYCIGDAHIYENQIEGIKNQIKRIPLIQPRLKIKKEYKKTKNIHEIIKFIESIEYGDIELQEYYSYPSIKIEMSA